MKKTLGVIVSVINVISFILVAIFGVIGVIYDLFGYSTFMKIFEKLNITWSFKQIWLFVAGCIIILIVSHILRKKVFKIKIFNVF